MADEELPVIAKFEVRRRAYLAPDGAILRDLPNFAADQNLIVSMYRGMALARAFDLRAVSLQRTGRLGTYATSLGQEAVAVGIASAMRPEEGHRRARLSRGGGSAVPSRRQLLRSFNPGVICGHDSVTSSRYVEARAGGTMPTIASKHRSSFGTDCVQCGNELIAPERSEYRGGRHVLHLWRCPNCGHSFEVIWSADTRFAAPAESSNRGVNRHVQFRREIFARPSTRSMKSAIAKLITLRLISRLTVDGARPRPWAICRIDRPTAMPREISSRSSSLSAAKALRRGAGTIPP